MKVNDYVRFYKKRAYSDSNIYFLGKVTRIEELIIEIKFNYKNKKNFIILSKSECFKYKLESNLEDLLEVDDIVHWEYIGIHQLSERDDDFKKVIQKVQSILDDVYQIDNIKQFIKSTKGKITAIELHENRVKQVIE